MKSKVSFQNIADKVGVSKSLVSFALNGKYGVSDETRLKILVAAMDLGYDFNQISAENLKLKQKKKILVILDRGCIDDLPYWACIVKSVEKEIDMQNMSLLFVPLNSFDDYIDMVSSILHYNCSGIVLIGSLPNALIDKIISLKIPQVLIDTNYLSPHVNQVLANNMGAGYDVAHYLIEKQFRHICFVGYPDYSMSFRQRFNGIQDYFEHKSGSLGICFDAIVEQPNSEQDDPVTYARGAFRSYLHSHRPEVIVCANDFTALDVYKVLGEYKIEIPSMMSVISFDNSNSCEMVDPKLTSVDVFKETLGQEAIRLLTQSIRDPLRLKINLQVETLIVERQSVQEPSRKAKEVAGALVIREKGKRKISAG